MSKQVRDFYFHGNAGFSWRPNADSDIFPSASLVPAPDVTLFTPFVGGSAIYRLRPMVNLMLESVFTWQDDVVAPGRSERSFGSLLSPGVRGGWNLGEQADHRRRSRCRSSGRTTRPTSACSAYFSFEGAVLEA